MSEERDCCFGPDPALSDAVLQVQVLTISEPLPVHAALTQAGLTLQQRCQRLPEQIQPQSVQEG
ncbi:hypothetical protein [Gloeobacter kilaueensis]|uniref:Uncharacterized protein n=1 Tax=Gloeobacter kilaueensis (strain ATCC BAA-2537 / CCAP 1431/1 / ULC 316 / JS1) TaxID=1183438 RepID=U5QLD3_GLOK1|nr:hypothetical protein [Gloeobacter kilaueensis]AGY58475.1 hypothetical protein GKIL_2229 [Gloeobacter kilaueensis JS1]